MMLCSAQTLSRDSSAACITNRKNSFAIKIPEVLSIPKTVSPSCLHLEGSGKAGQHNSYSFRCEGVAG